jgi:hypothetical protein
MAKVEKKLEFAPVREVFGVNRQKNTLSYIERAIDGKFKDALQDGQYSAIVIYGTSKQGKSSLRRHVLPETRIIHIASLH